jgi:thiol:disulfide interchange protein DsbD
MRTLLLITCLWLTTPALAGPWDRGAPALLPVDQAFILEPVTWQAGELRLEWRIAPGYYLYRHRMALELPGVSLQLPAGLAHADEHFGEVRIYRDHVRASAALAQPPDQLGVSYQGCADAGVCYPVQTRRVAVERLP